MSTHTVSVMSSQVFIQLRRWFTCWGGGLTQWHRPLWACVAVTEPARPPAWRQLGSGFYSQRPPWKALIDWRLIFLTGWNPATKTTEQSRGSGGAKKLLYDREGERQGTNVQGKERKTSFLMFVRWYRLYGSNLGLVFPLQGGKKKIQGQCGNKSRGQKKNEKEEENFLLNYIYFQ